jgi:hypothetical protein
LKTVPVIVVAGALPISEIPVPFAAVARMVP